MNISNIHDLPQAFVEAVKNDPYSAGTSDISVTKLIDAPQRRVLINKYRDSIVEDASERVWSLLGQAVHTILERQDQGKSVIAEDRLYADVDGWKVSGQFDRMDLREGVLDDYKVTGTYKAQMDDHVEWERQLNVLRWLAVKNGYTVNKLRIVAILRDWHKSGVLRDPNNYPKIPVKIIEIPIWDLSEAQTYVENRVWIHQMAEQGDVKPCSDEERWFSGNSYALMKEGGKRAIKIFERKEDAEEKLADGCFIEERRGTYRRCADYCEVSQFCEQYRPDREDTSAAEW